VCRRTSDDRMNPSVYSHSLHDALPTSGAALAGALDGRPGIRVVVLFPAGRVSERQRRQLTCWGDNVLALEVAGSFDDCQALVKQDRKSTRLNSSHVKTSYAVFCLIKKQ